MCKDWKLEYALHDEIVLSRLDGDHEVEFVVVYEDDSSVDVWTVYNFHVDMDMVEDYVEDYGSYATNLYPELSEQEIIIACVTDDIEHFCFGESEYEEFPFKTLAVINAEKYTEMGLSDEYESVSIGEVQDWISDELYLSADASDLLDRVVEHCHCGTFDDKTEEFCWWLDAIMSEEQIELIRELDIDWW